MLLDYSLVNKVGPNWATRIIEKVGDCYSKKTKRKYALTNLILRYKRM